MFRQSCLGPGDHYSHLNECPKYARHRPLLGTGQNAHLESLIGTEKGIKRLTKFIVITKAIDKQLAI